MIRRHTIGGVLELHDQPGTDMRCSCGVAGGHDGEPLIAIRVELAAGRHDGGALEMALCADCVSTALAMHLGRQHVQTGGDLDDLKIPPS